MITSEQKRKVFDRALDVYASVRSPTGGYVFKRAAEMDISKVRKAANDLIDYLDQIGA